MAETGLGLGVLQFIYKLRSLAGELKAYGVRH